MVLQRLQKRLLILSRSLVLRLRPKRAVGVAVVEPAAAVVGSLRLQRPILSPRLHPQRVLDVDVVEAAAVVAEVLQRLQRRMVPRKSQLAVAARASPVHRRSPHRAVDAEDVDAEDVVPRPRSVLASSLPVRTVLPVRSLTP